MRTLNLILKNKDNEYLQHLKEILSDDIILIIYDYIPYMNTYNKLYMRDYYTFMLYTNNICYYDNRIIFSKKILETIKYCYYPENIKMNIVNDGLLIFDNKHMNNLNKYIMMIS